MNRAIQAIRANGYAQINYDLAWSIGLNETLILSVLAWQELEHADNEGWFYCTVQTLEYYTTLTRKQQLSAIQKLIDLGIIEKQLRDMPRKRFFRIIDDPEIIYGYMTAGRTNRELVREQGAEIGELHEFDQYVQKGTTSRAKRGQLVGQKGDINNNILKKTYIKTKAKADAFVSDESDRDTLENDEGCDVQAIVDMYHEICTTLPRITKITDKRRKHIKARYKDCPNGMQDIRKVFESVNASDLLSGRRKSTDDKYSNWRCDIDWIINPNNWVKIAEGKYPPSKPPSDEPLPAWRKIYKPDR